ncbi:uncharacterized protein LOC120647611 isoform X1 [Panicum virgatum]|uniref:uncharacterized protein LOC120647611 isoform X1 n=1 Tax=Panicum virgatum TaxID=38727 RepID=UPI0019D4FA66|nr:uncharacterized protein LOC120647611 isoform X1 [Panicum virgatum]
MESAKRMRAAMSNDEDTTSHGSAGVGVAATEGDDMTVVAADEQEQMGSAETEDHIQRILAAIDNYTRQVSGHLILISCIIAGAHAMRACVCRCRRCWMPGARCSRTSPPTSRSASARSTGRGLSGGRRRSGSCAPATPPTSRPAPSSTMPSCTSSTPSATKPPLLSLLRFYFLLLLGEF